MYMLRLPLFFGIAHRYRVNHTAALVKWGLKDKGKIDCNQITSNMKAKIVFFYVYYLPDILFCSSAGNFVHVFLPLRCLMGVFSKMVIESRATKTAELFQRLHQALESSSVRDDTITMRRILVVYLQEMMTTLVMCQCCKDIYIRKRLVPIQKCQSLYYYY